MKTFFQKTIFFLSLPLLLFSFYPSKSYALAEIDQKCITEGSGQGLVGYSRVSGTSPDYQIFVPTKNTLDAISVRVVGFTTSIRMDVIDAYNPPYYTIASMTKTFDGSEQWLTFDFRDVPMPFSGYAIAISNTDPTHSLMWKYRTECYSRGYSLMNGAYQADKDFGFSVYAYDSDTNSGGNNPGGGAPGSQPQQPSPAQPPTTGPNGSIASPFGTIPGNQAAPLKETASSILPPTNLTAEDAELDYGGAIDLNWTASNSSDIDGYKVFRRAEDDPQFRELIKLPKTFTSFTDPWATKGKTYYYMLRSYKGSQESSNSNVASATSKDDLNELVDDIRKDQQKSSRFIGGPIVIAVSILIVLMIIGLFILGLWVLFHKKKQPPPASPNL